MFDTSTLSNNHILSKLHLHYEAKRKSSSHKHKFEELKPTTFSANIVNCSTPLHKSLHMPFSSKDYWNIDADIATTLGTKEETAVAAKSNGVKSKEELVIVSSSLATFHMELLCNNNT